MAPDLQDATSQKQAQIFHQLVRGVVSPETVVEHTDGGQEVTLGNHPDFAKVVTLVDGARAAHQIIPGHWTKAPQSWTADLNQVSFAAIVFKIAIEHLSGVLVASHKPHLTSIGFSNGDPTTANSNRQEDQLTELLRRTNKIDAERLQQVDELIAKTKNPVSWALLHLGLLTLDELIAAQRQQARERFVALCRWQHGRVVFYPDQRLRDQPCIVEATGLDLLRSAFQELSDLEPKIQTATLRPLIDGDRALKLVCPVSKLGSLQDVEQHVLQHAARGESANHVLQHFGEPHSGAWSEAAAALLMFAHMGILRFATGAALPHLKPLPGTHPHFETLPGDGLAPTATSGEALLDSVAHAVSTVTPEPAAAVTATENANLGVDTNEATSGTATSSGMQAVASPTNELEEYQLQQKLLSQGKRLLGGYAPQDALEPFRTLVARPKPPVEAYAYMAIATLLAHGQHAHAEAHRWAKQAIERDSENALAKAAMSRVMESYGQHATAAKFKDEALELSRNSTVWNLEVNSALQASAHAPGQLVAVIAGNNLGIAATLATVAVASLFVLSNLLGMGGQEYFYSGTDPFFYIRRLTLLAAGGLCLWLYTRSHPLELLRHAFGSVGPRALLAAIPLGLAVGLFSPLQRTNGSLVVVLGLTLLHVVSEEVFFRGFVTRVCLETIDVPKLAIGLSGLLFGLYHITYFSFWVETSIPDKIYWIATIALFAGVPLAALYHWGKGLWPPLLGHALINGTMMVQSVLHQS